MNSVWTANGYSNLIMEATSHLTYLETVKNDGMPDADSLHYHIKNKITSTDILRCNFLELTRKQLRKLRGRKAILILDETHEPFYGNVNSIIGWVHEYKPEKGCTGSLKFLCASILIGDERYFLDAVPIKVFYDMRKEVEEMLDRIIQNYGIKIEVALLDRGFGKSSEIISLFEERRIKYIMLFLEFSNVKEIIKGVESFKRIQFEVKGVKTKLVVIRDENKGFYWKFVTNLAFRDFWKYVKVYRMRWNIETGFRVTDEARIKSKSIDMRVRYFFFLTSLILYNMWYILDKPVPFRRFVISFFEIIEKGLDNSKCRVT